MRRVVIFLLAVGAMAAVGTFAARTAELPRVALPPQAAVLPPDSSFIISVDLRRLVESPLYQRFGSGPLQGRKEMWVELERRTGLHAERDFSQLIAAGSGRSDDSGLALFLGRFERAKVEAALGRDGSGAAARAYAGHKIWRFESRSGQKASAVSILEDGALVAGSPVEVEAALDRRAAKGAGLTGNAALVALAAKADPKATFWMCGDQGLLSAMGGASSKTAGWTIPSVKTFVASGDLAPDVAASVLAQTADDAAAKGVTDMLRGLLGLLAMQSAQQPALKELASGIAIEQQGPEVKIAARLSYDTLAKLSPPSTPQPTPTTTPTTSK